MMIRLLPKNRIPIMTDESLDAAMTGDFSRAKTHFHTDTP